MHPRARLASSPSTSLTCSSDDTRRRELKTRTLGWSLPDELRRLDATIEQRPRASDAQLRRAFRAFFRAPHDIHTSLELPPGRAVWLGFHAVSTDAGVRVAWIDPRLAPSIPLGVGDEMDEVPRVGTSARLVVRSSGRDATEKPVELTWRDADSDGPSERCPFWPRTKRSVLPPPGNILWTAPDTAFFGGYAFAAAGRRYGFVRLHTYSIPRDMQQKAMRDFDDAIDAFTSRNVDALVIDQRGNGGGNFLLAYTMLARLFDRPLVPPRQRFLVDGDEVVGFGHRKALSEIASELGRAQTDPNETGRVQRNLAVLRSQIWPQVAFSSRLVSSDD